MADFEGKLSVVCSGYVRTKPLLRRESRTSVHALRGQQPCLDLGPVPHDDRRNAVQRGERDVMRCTSTLVIPPESAKFSVAGGQLGLEKKTGDRSVARFP